MIFSKEKITVIASAAVLCCAVYGVTSVTNHIRTASDDEADTEISLTAGVSTAFLASDFEGVSFTSGVSTVLNDFPTVTISDSVADLVAQGLDLDDEEDAAEESDEPADAEEAAEEDEDGTFCGYTNLGIANVTSANLNVREEPSTDGKIVGKMTSHNACEIVATEGDWYQITSGSVSGYVKSEYLYTGEEALEVAKGEVTTYATVTTNTLRVRSEASTESDIISLVNLNEDLVVVEELDEWVLVEVDDESGYVYKDYVTVAQKLPTAKTITEIRYGEGVSDVRVDLVQYALQFVGNRYVWGGESLTKGVDCSGFTMKIYQKYGIYLPHSSRSQPSYGKKIKASEAKPGDIFFYGKGSTINHCAIYIGDGKIVHASNKRDGIKISNAYYRTPICVVSYLDD